MLASLILLLYKNTEMRTCQKKWLEKEVKIILNHYLNLKWQSKNLHNILDIINKGTEKKSRYNFTTV